MKINDVVNEGLVQEIQRLAKNDFAGGKEELSNYTAGKIIKPLPGGSGLLYSIQQQGSVTAIRLWDAENKGDYEPTKKPTKYLWQDRGDHLRDLDKWEKDNQRRQRQFNRAPGVLAGELTVMPAKNFPIPNAVKVYTITTDEKYRGRGLAKALYGIVLTIMKKPLLAGSGQTPGGRRNWVSISQIPGVAMKGYVGIRSRDLTTKDAKNPDYTSWERTWARQQNTRAEKTIDTVMGQLGGQYIGQTGKPSDPDYYFAFDVQPDATAQELKSYVETNLSKIYTSSYGDDCGLFAVWTGR